MKDIFAEAEKSENAAIVLSVFGFTQFCFEGKNYLIPASREEFIEAYVEVRGVTQEDAQKAADLIERAPSCFMNNIGSCVGRCPYGGPCTKDCSGGAGICFCGCKPGH